jgi:hypothetical protein
MENASVGIGAKPCKQALFAWQALRGKANWSKNPL